MKNVNAVLHRCRPIGPEWKCELGADTECAFAKLDARTKEISFGQVGHFIIDRVSQVNGAHPNVALPPGFIATSRFMGSITIQAPDCHSAGSFRICGNCPGTVQM